MNDARVGTITILLNGLRSTDREAVWDSLLPLVYDELRDAAAAFFSHERSSHTLQPTALVHEAWLKIARGVDRVENRVHFFAVASQVMRRVLIDHARGRDRMKRKPGVARVTLDERFGAANRHGIELTELDDSLRRLAELNPRHARVVELRVFGGLTIAETVEVLGVSHSTVESDWFMARAWLRTELGHDE